MPKHKPGSGLGADLERKIDDAARLATEALLLLQTLHAPPRKRGRGRPRAVPTPDHIVRTVETLDRARVKVSALVLRALFQKIDECKIERKILATVGEHPGRDATTAAVRLIWLASPFEVRKLVDVLEDEEIAACLGIDARTLRTWRRATGDGRKHARRPRPDDAEGGNALNVKQRRRPTDAEEDAAE